MLRHRPVRYTIVGIWNSLFGFAMYAIALWLLPQLTPTQALIVTSPIAILQAYLSQRRLVWHSRSPWVVELPPFVAVYLVSLAVNAVFLWFISRLLPPLPAQAISLGATAVITYFIHRAWTFRHAPRRSSAESPHTSTHDPRGHSDTQGGT